MSMLAERKQKQKWSLNPRGKYWSEDSNKLGLKLLEKMGWTNGMGLGRNEDGETKHVQLPYKNDSKGLGYTQTEQWTEHDEIFSQLLDKLSSLSSLSMGGDHTTTPQSLEEQSQKSRARVHYHKFTKGKDMSQYSEKDLANIFGKATLRPREGENTPTDEAEVDTDDQNLLYRGSMVDYFKNKLKKKKLAQNDSGYVVGNNGVLKRQRRSSGSESERPAFGFGFHSGAQPEGRVEDERRRKRTHADTETSCEDDSRKKKKCKKRKMEAENDEGGQESCLNGATHANADPDVEVPETASRKKKKDRKSKTQVEFTVGEDVETAEVAYEKTAVKKKKGRDGTGETYMSYVNEETTVVSGMCDVQEKDTKEKRKSKKSDARQSEESSVATDELERIADKKSKKNKRKDRDETQAPVETFVSYIYQEASAVEEIDTKRKRKEKRSKSEQVLSDVQVEGGIKLSKRKKDKRSVEDSETEKSKKKRREEADDEILGLANSAFDPFFNQVKVEKHALNTIKEEDERCDLDRSGSGNDSADLKAKKKKSKKRDEDPVEDGAGNPYEVKIKKEKKSKAEECGLDNPIFACNGTDLSPAEHDSSNPYEVKTKKKKIKLEAEHCGLDNPVFDCNVSDPRGHDCTSDGFEVKRKKKKGKEGAINEACNLNDGAATSTGNTECTRKKSREKGIAEANDGVESNCDIDDGDLILNVASLPAAKPKEKVKSGKRNRHDASTSKKTAAPTDNSKAAFANVVDRLSDSIDKSGMDNACFNEAITKLEEIIGSMKKKMDRSEAEVENNINEEKMKKKMDLKVPTFVGEPGEMLERHAKVDEGTRLSFRNVTFGKVSPWLSNEKGPKKSYKNLIGGDIILCFKNTNLHNISGYAVRKR